MRKKNGVNFSLNAAAKARRVKALARLEQSLEDGVKTVKKTVNEKVVLNDSDIKRINKEIENLKAKIARS